MYIIYISNTSNQLKYWNIYTSLYYF